MYLVIVGGTRDNSKWVCSVNAVDIGSLDPVLNYMSSGRLLIL